MGIQGLYKLLQDRAPASIKETKFEQYFGRKIAVDASMHIYQFMVVVGRQGDQLLTNEAGEITSHLQGMFNRTTRMLEAGMKPVYVFEGKPPELKRAQLAQRSDRREGADAALAQAKESGDAEEIEKYAKRSIKVTREHNDECKRLLTLMGVPIVEAPTEAEAQCASMVQAGVCYGVATEDMDSLTFGASRMVRHLMAPASANQPVIEIDRAKAVEGLGLTDEQFIDFCILCGCDYAPRIKGIGPERALALIQKHGSLDEVLKSLDPAKFSVPTDYPHKEAHAFFKDPEVTPSDQLPPLKWGAPDEEGLVAFLVGEKQFSEDRVRKAVKKIQDSKGRANQGRMESFFQVIQKPAAAKPAATGKDGKGAAGGKGGLATKGGVAKKGKSGVGGAAPKGKK